MLPGPTMIKKCQECSGLIKVRTIMSGNTFGAKLWTDGKMDARMLLVQPWLIKCPHCKSLIWIDDQKEVGEIYDQNLPEWNLEENKFEDPDGYGEYKDAKLYDEPSFNEFFSKLSTGNYSFEQERYIRINIWRKGNDRRRTAEKKENLTNDEVNNLKSLDNLTGTDDEKERIMKAEIKRELCLFVDAEKILNILFANDKYLNIVSTIGKLIQKQDPFVAEVKFNR